MLERDSEGREEWKEGRKEGGKRGGRKEREEEGGPKRLRPGDFYPQVT